MPLIKSKSKKAFSHNVAAEMDAGKPQDQALAIAYDAKRRAKRKKMAEGGEAVAYDPKAVPKPPSPADAEAMKRIFGAKGGSVDEMPAEKENQSGVHKIVANSDYVHNEMKHGQSEARYGNKKAKHEKVLAELRNMPSPKLEGMAEGGPVESRSNNSKRLMPIKHPKMAKSDVFSTRLRDEEDHLESSAAPASPNEQPPIHDDKEGADRQGPSTPSLEMEMMAEGGMTHEMDEQPEPEANEDHHDSIAAAIMAKRRMMAEGGHINGMDSIYSDDSDQAELSRNAEEDANMEDQASFDALRKENYSESEGLEHMDSPSDSNEHGHEIDSDRHDMVSSIRSKMRARRQFR